MAIDVLGIIVFTLRGFHAGMHAFHTAAAATIKLGRARIGASSVYLAIIVNTIFAIISGW